MIGTSGHEHWAELAAGHALSALEPAEDAAFIAHAAGCDTCRRLVADVSGVMADLAHVTPVEPPPQLRAAILNRLDDDGRRWVAIEEQPAAVPERRHANASARRHRWAGLAAAACVMLLAAIAAGVWALVGQNGQGAQEPTVAARCAQVHCPTVSLQAGGRSAATLMVLDDVAYVDTSGLPATGPDSSYVLWRIGADGQPVGIAAFDGQPGAGAVRVAALGVPVSVIDTFAISREPGHAVPPAPTDVVAQGTVA